MTTIINKISNDLSIIEWADKNSSGQIEFKWDKSLGKWIVDSEHLGIESLIKIIKAIE